METSEIRRPKMGENVALIRELLGMSQEQLAEKMHTTQQTISRIEASDTIEEEKLKSVAEALGVTPDTIRNFDRQAAVNHMNNIHNNHDNSVMAVVYYQLSPIDKIIEMSNKNAELYERLLASEKEKTELMQKLMDDKTRKQ